MAARKKKAEVVGDVGEGGAGGDEDPNIMADDDSNDQNESMQATTDVQTGASTAKKLKVEAEEEESFDLKAGILGIDQAILQSIEKCGMY